VNKRIPVKLNRFTCLDELHDLLKSKELTLTNPSNWQDKNDIKIIREYEKRKVKRVFLKCFCGGNETIHHWQSFSSSREGCCIQFDAKKLLKYIHDADTDIKHEWIEYKYVSEVITKKPPLSRYPFTKRKPYHVENEYRIVYFGTKRQKYKKVPIKLDCITKITLSPLISNEVFQTKRKSLRKSYNLKPSMVKINKSHVYYYEKWVDAFC